jgi:hypothetical protein
VHAGLAAALVLLFVLVLEIRSWLDVAALVLPLTVLTGLHTFTGLLQEAYPVNHFLQVSVACLTVLALARTRPSRVTSALTVIVLVYSLALIEAGILVWVVAAASYGAGLPGLRRGPILALTLIVALYIGARSWLDIGTPGIGAHGTGFVDAAYSADEIAARFGDAPVFFMTYNVASAALSVLFSEPRHGTYGLLQPPARWPPALGINIVSSAMITLAIVGYAWAAWRRRKAPVGDDRLVLVALVAVGANAFLCATYIKDEMLGTAGIFYALASYAAVRALLAAVPRTPRAPAALTVAVVLAVTASLWSFRAMGVHYQLRYAAFITRNDWVRVLPPHDRDEWPQDPRAVAVTHALKNAAINQPTTSSRFLPVWGDRYWKPQ